MHLTGDVPLHKVTIATKQRGVSDLGSLDYITEHDIRSRRGSAYLWQYESSQYSCIYILMPSKRQVCCNSYLGDVNGANSDPFGDLRAKSNRQAVQAHLPAMSFSQCQRIHCIHLLYLSPVRFECPVTFAQRQHTECAAKGMCSKSVTVIWLAEEAPA